MLSVMCIELTSITLKLISLGVNVKMGRLYGQSIELSSFVPINTENNG